MAGRPSKYEDSFAEQVYNYCLLGATDDQLADFFDVNVDTINDWKKTKPEFSDALKRGKVLADLKVADSLFQRACGYQHPDTDIKVINGQIVKTDITKHYPPDTTAAIFWLKNRQKNSWRDKIDVENSVKVKNLPPWLQPDESTEDGSN